jgi:glycosyltransferase involved in cell wall biosynthesis
VPNLATLVNPNSLGIARYARSLEESLERLGWNPAPLATADVVHVHYGNSSRQLNLRRVVRGKPLVVTVHDALPRHKLLRSLVGARWVRKWTTQADQVVVHTHAAQRMIRGPAHLVPMMSFPSATEAQEVPADGPLRIGVFGRMASHKGLQWIAAALDQLDGVQIHLTLCGPGAAAAKRYLEWPQTDVVEGATDSEFDELMARQHAILSIRHDSVGEASAVSAQAIGLGVPIISNVGNPTHANFGEACIEIESHIALSDTLRDLATQPALRTRLSSQARASSSLCALETVAAAYDRILRSARAGPT